MVIFNTLLAQYSYHQFLIILISNTDFRNSISLTVISYSSGASLPNISITRYQYLSYLSLMVYIYIYGIYVCMIEIHFDYDLNDCGSLYLNRNTFIYGNRMIIFCSSMGFYSYWHLEDRTNYVVWSR